MDACTLGPCTLPRTQFNRVYDFESLATDNRFLFRVQDSLSYTGYSTERGFIAGLYKFQPADELPKPSTEVFTRENIMNHMRWGTQRPSPLISTSFSFPWALWEAYRRKRDTRLPHDDISISVIDTGCLHPYPSALALRIMDILRARGDAVPELDLKNFALASQEVLIHGYVSADAVVTVIPLDEKLEARLPAWLNSPKNVDPWTTRYSAFCASDETTICRFIDGGVHIAGNLRLKDVVRQAVALAGFKLASVDEESLMNTLYSLAKHHVVWALNPFTIAGLDEVVEQCLKKLYEYVYVRRVWQARTQKCRTPRTPKKSRAVI